MDSTNGLTMRVAHAAEWQLVNATTRLVLQLAVIAVLARLVSVPDFGLMGQALFVVGLVGILAQAGMASAIIQTRELTHGQIETAITISLLGGFLFTLLTWFAAPLAGIVYQSAESVPVLKALAPIFTFSAVSTTVLAIEQRKLDFRKLFWIDTVAYAVGYGVVGIPLAWHGFGVWALAAAALVEAAVRAVAAIGVAEHRPCFPPKFNECRALAQFGFGMSATGIVMYAARNLDYLIVGRMLGPAAVGYYMRSYQLMMAPLSRFSTVMNSALFPAYARLQDEPLRLRRGFYQNLQLVALVVFPALSILGALGYETIHVVLGPNWDGSVAPFRWLCAAGVLLCVSDAGEIVIRAKGEIRGRLMRYLVTAPVMVLAVAAGARWGVAGAAAGAAVAIAVQYLLMAELVLRLVDGRWLEFFRAQATGALLAIGHGMLALAVAFLLRNQQLPDAIVLVGTAAICVCVYLLTVLTFEQQLLPPAARLVLDTYRPHWLRRAIPANQQP